MGFNIAGIAINANLEDNITELSNILGENLVLDSEIDFETASENWKEEGIFDVYFGDHGTLIFGNTESLDDDFKAPKLQVFTFAISETSMLFAFTHSENNKILRAVMNVEGETVDEHGDELDAEENHDDISEVIWKQMSNVLGESYWKIEPDAKAYRYRIKENMHDKEDREIEAVYTAPTPKAPIVPSTPVVVQETDTPSEESEDSKKMVEILEIKRDILHLPE